MKLPNSAEAEKSVLGAILADPENLILLEGMLRSEHFFSDVHQKIYSAILDLSARGQSVDIVTVLDEIQEKSGGNFPAAYLVDLTEHAPTAQNLAHHAEIIKRHFYVRRVIASCKETIESALAWDGKIEGYLENVEKSFLSIAHEIDGQKKGLMSADRVLESTIDDIQKRLERGGQTTGVASGFKKLDDLTGGLQKSDLIILAARPGMGKTALALNIATHAFLTKKSTVFFSIEMSKEQLMSRVMASVAKVDSARLRRGDLDDDEQDRLMEGARQIYECKDFFAVDETPGITLMEIRSRCRRYAREKGLDLIVIDYLQLMGSSQRKRGYDSREREISEISMGLKELAKELKVPVIALAQLNRGPDARPDKRPRLSDLRESGSLEQDADLILLIYRDEYYDPNSEDQGLAEVIVGKNRHGATTTFKLAYQAHSVCFRDIVDVIIE